MSTVWIVVNFNRLTVSSFERKVNTALQRRQFNTHFPLPVSPTITITWCFVNYRRWDINQTCLTPKGTSHHNDIPFHKILPSGRIRVISCELQEFSCKTERGVAWWMGSHHRPMRIGEQPSQDYYIHCELTITCCTSFAFTIRGTKPYNGSFDWIVVEPPFLRSLDL